MVFVPDQSNEVDVLDDDDGSVSPDLPYFEGLTVQLEFLIVQYLDNTQLQTSKA